ncbi:hypothetical protein LEN26_008268 [Aphanomyces euteiches]|nr:hypothetical protein AeMF1_004138 [Aphanomyces euteiches]KAH9130706.1 hypothetical protein LEN26_008268 [Aphanomyces euteiches]
MIRNDCRIAFVRKWNMDATKLNQIALLVRATISHYCVKRRVNGLPRECFEDRIVGGLETQVLKRTTLEEASLALRLHNARHIMLEFGVTECLERDCLRRLTFCIYEASSNVLVEVLTLEFITEAGKDTDIHERYLALVRTMSLMMETLAPLPSESTFQVDVALHSNRVPYAWWEPPYLGGSRPSGPVPHGSADSISMGSIWLDKRGYRVSLQVFSRDPPSTCAAIAFDPVFRQESKESWYAVVKELVERTQKPVLLFVKRSFPTLDHATAQWCFRQLVAEQIIRRHGRGRRYQMAPTSIPMADTTSKQAMGQAIHGLYNSSTTLKPTARRRSQAINSVIQTTSMVDCE